MTIMQGDQYELKFHITIDQQEVDITTIKMIQFKVGDILKTYVSGAQEQEIVYDDEEEEHIFYFPLSQHETYAMKDNNAICEVRIHFVDDTIKGAVVSAIPVQFSTIEV